MKCLIFVTALSSLNLAFRGEPPRSLSLRLTKNTSIPTSRKALLLFAIAPTSEILLLRTGESPHGL